MHKNLSITIVLQRILFIAMHIPTLSIAKGHPQFPDFNSRFNVSCKSIKMLSFGKAAIKVSFGLSHKKSSIAKVQIKAINYISAHKSC